MEELILKERELKEEIVQAINRASLPAVMIKPIINELLIQITALEQEQYEQAKINRQKEQEERNKQNRQNKPKAGGKK